MCLEGKHLSGIGIHPTPTDKQDHTEAESRCQGWNEAVCHFLSLLTGYSFELCSVCVCVCVAEAEGEVSSMEYVVLALLAGKQLPRLGICCAACTMTLAGSKASLWGTVAREAT